MRFNPIILFGCALLFLITGTGRVTAAVDTQVMRSAFIQDSDAGYLVVVDGKVKFQVRETPGTLWNVAFRKDGFWIVNAKTGRLLGIDSKTKELALFDEPGVTTTWQFKSAGAPPKPSDAFKVILMMEVAKDELRLSADDMGNPIVGGKASLLLFDRWSP